MALQPIPFPKFRTDLFHLFDRQWMVLTAGDFARREFNPMTISWGSLGWIWGRPFVHVVVRPQRHTHAFLERFDTFTLTAFSEMYRRALNVLGNTSGRDGDKVAAAGLTPVAAEKVAAPAFAEAELVLECRKIFRAQLEPGQFLDPTIEQNYPEHDYHTVYYGEVVLIRGEGRFSADHRGAAALDE